MTTLTVPSARITASIPSPVANLGPWRIDNVEWSFRVWAPFADHVSMVSDNGDAPVSLVQDPAPTQGHWSILRTDVRPGDRYRYRIHNPSTGATVEKIDPYVRLATGTGPNDYGIIHNPGAT